MIGPDKRANLKLRHYRTLEALTEALADLDALENAGGHAHCDDYGHQRQPEAFNDGQPDGAFV